MTKILTASLAMEAAKKKDKGKGAHSKAGAPVIQARLLAGLPDCNMAGSKGKFLRSPYLPAVRAASKIVVLKSKQSSRSLRTSQMKLPRQDDMVFKVPKDEKRKVILSCLCKLGTQGRSLYLHIHVATPNIQWPLQYLCSNEVLSCLLC